VHDISGKMSKSAVWKNIFGLILPHRRRFIIIVLIGLLGTGANLVEPLIYREAVNDIAGLFVQQAKDAASDTDENAETYDSPLTSFIEKGFSFSPSNPKEAHKSNYVAGRSPEQALHTLIWAVVILFIVNLFRFILVLVSENMNVRLSATIEQRFIQNTFSHVLRLPLVFFTRRSSAALSKQINQSEEVSGIVNGFSQQILPEILSLVGILAIMLLQNLPLTLIALSIIPFYLMLAWQSANRLEAGLSSYYEKWEDLSARMQDALSGIKTVKLSGAESREAERLRKISQSAYTDYVGRTRLSNQYVFLAIHADPVSRCTGIGIWRIPDSPAPADSRRRCYVCGIP
jgi:ABC-type multidrug transport system fused ATPase/permease subunit